jgi:threonylcarbamoyladenosine tRNA methylthiotransferase MtaB
MPYNTAYIKNFGCKVNQSEADSLKKKLQKYLDFVDTLDLAEIVFINTCAVTEKASEKSLRFIKGVKRNFPDKKIILTGCLTGLLEQEFYEKNIDLLISMKDKENVRDILENQSYISKKKNVDKIIYNTHRTRAFLKIQDGCDNFCSYCVIPFLRGAPHSKPASIVIKELKSLLDYGYKEVVFVGIHLGKYGLGKNSTLASLLNMIENIDGNFRVRISSLEINELDENLIDIIERSEKICPHLHIPLQSGSNKILNLMNRNYTREKFKDKIYYMLNKIPEITLGLDVIVGFPGETELDFKETISLVDEIKPHYLHVFPYSDRPNTKASEMLNKVDNNILKDRVNIMKELAENLKIKAYKNKIGKKMRVLIEKEGIGFSDDYFKVLHEGGLANSFQYVEAYELDINKKMLRGRNIKERLNYRTIPQEPKLQQ